MRTRVGYAGGTLANPAYDHIGDHLEAIQIDYDPSRVTYEDLLDLFWEIHDPCPPRWTRQYMSVIFTHNETQRELAEGFKAREDAPGAIIPTKILPLTRFYPAEDRHQKYVLRQIEELMREFRAMYPREADFVNSTAAARVNGFVAGLTLAERIEAVIDQLGLSPEGRRLLRSFALPQ